MKKKLFKMDTSNIHELIALTTTLNYQLRNAEEIRKKITKLSLKLKRNERPTTL